MLTRLLEREPQQFMYFHRMMGYFILSLNLVIYAFTSPYSTVQIFVPALFLAILIVIPKLNRYLEDKFERKVVLSVFLL